jgi:hypothetical protein
MELIFKIMLGGGLFAILGFIHFFVDWIFQSHAEAMVKHNNAKVRAKHCAIYTAGFVPLMMLFHCLSGGIIFNWWETLLAINVLFWSHFGEDTYIPVYLWAKYIRRPPEMTEPIKQTQLDGYVQLLPPDPKVGFGLFIQGALGKILMITIDQIIHFAFLFPIVWIVLRHFHFDSGLFLESVSCNLPGR